MNRRTFLVALAGSLPVAGRCTEPRRYVLYFDRASGLFKRLYR